MTQTGNDKIIAIGTHNGLYIVQVYGSQIRILSTHFKKEGTDILAIGYIGGNKLIIGTDKVLVFDLKTKTVLSKI